MKILTKLLLFTFICLNSFASLPEYCSELEVSCNFYDECLEASRPCGDEGYSTAYGGKYCQKFIELDKLTFKGELWRDNTLLCLQEELLPIVHIYSDLGISCNEITLFAFDSHPGCYTQEENSLCKLPLKDILKINKTIILKDKLSKKGRRQIRKVAKICLRQIFKKKDKDNKKKKVFFRNLLHNN